MLLASVARKDSFNRREPLDKLRKRTTVSDTIDGTFFQLRLVLRTAETDSQVTFKNDGGRFEKSQITLKLKSNTDYKLILKTRPKMEFHTLKLSGRELKLKHVENSDDFYVAWTTNGIVPTPEGCRDEVEMILTGDGKMLFRDKLQVKFYAPSDDHANWGRKLDAIIWNLCLPNNDNNANEEIVIVDEQII